VPTATHAGTVLGTVGYMSPEQASGKPLDFRSDQFSFGSILYEMATGKRAFQRATSAETLTAIIREEVEPVERVNAAAPAPLRWILDRCLQKEPEERYGSTRDLAQDLKNVASTFRRRPSPGRPRVRSSRRRPRPDAASSGGP
jgi:serine/threonine protein kinase